MLEKLLLDKLGILVKVLVLINYNMIVEVMKFKKVDVGFLLLIVYILVYD